MWGRALRNDVSAMKFLRFQGNSRILRKMRKTGCPTRAAGRSPAIHRRFQLIRLLRVRHMHNPSVSVPPRRPIPPGIPYPYSPLPPESDGVFPSLGNGPAARMHGSPHGLQKNGAGAGCAIVCLFWGHRTAGLRIRADLVGLHLDSRCRRAGDCPPYPSPPDNASLAQSAGMAANPPAAGRMAGFPTRRRG